MTFELETDLALVQMTEELARMRAELDVSSRLATHDALTGLPGRRTISDRLDEAILQSADGGDPVAAIFVDVDRFKVVNDLYGHAVGDQVLREVALRLSEAVGDDGEVGRLGGDEFVVVVRGAPSGRLERLTDSVLRGVGPTIDVGHRRFPLSVSVGVARAHPDSSAAVLLDRADLAMYRAKQSGRGTAVHFDEEMERELTERAELGRELSAALQDGELCVHYQPTFNVLTGAVIGFEALVRWQNPRRGLLPASSFVPIAEDMGEVWAIDAFVLAETARRISDWQRLAPRFSDLVMSVNLSSQQFRDSSLVATISDAISAAGIVASSFQLEITESAVTDPRSGDATTVLRNLHDLGVKLAMDNFGTGSSSLACLRELPFDVLNIDRRFIAGLGADRDDEAIVSAVLHLARSFAIEAVAEGVETAGQHSWLVRNGCHLAQGFHYSHPLSPQRAEELLRTSSG